MGNEDKIVGYFTECRDLGIKVLGPDVNKSQKNFTVVDDAIRFGLAAIKNVGEGAVESVLAIRTDSGPFTSFFDFCRRVDLHKVNKRMLEGLIKTGAFDSLGAKRSQLVAVSGSGHRGRRGLATGTSDWARQIFLARSWTVGGTKLPGSNRHCPIFQSGIKPSDSNMNGN